MTSIINAMIAFGFKPSLAGTCHGLAHMACQAVIRNDFKTFLARYHLIQKTPTKDLLKAVDLARKYQQTQQPLNAKEHAFLRRLAKNLCGSDSVSAKNVGNTILKLIKLLISVPTFFENVLLYQKPYRFPDIFPPGQAAHVQFDPRITHIISILAFNEKERQKAVEQKQPSATEQKARHNTSIHAYNKAELTRYLEQLATIDQHASENIAFLLTNTKHAMALHKSGNSWILVNHDKLLKFDAQRLDAVKTLASIIINSFLGHSNRIDEETIATFAVTTYLPENQHQSYQSELTETQSLADVPVVNRKDFINTHPLELAVIEDDEKETKKLLSAVQTMSDRDHELMIASALEWSQYIDNPAITQLLIAQKECQKPFRELSPLMQYILKTVLYYAIKYKYQKKSLLLKKHYGAELLNEISAEVAGLKSKAKAVEVSAKYGDLLHLEFLLETLDAHSFDIDSALKAAAQNNRPACVNALVKYNYSKRLEENSLKNFYQYYEKYLLNPNQLVSTRLILLGLLNNYIEKTQKRDEKDYRGISFFKVFKGYSAGEKLAAAKYLYQFIKNKKYEQNNNLLSQYYGPLHNGELGRIYQMFCDRLCQNVQMPSGSDRERETTTFTAH